MSNPYKIPVDYLLKCVYCLMPKLQLSVTLTKSGFLYFSTSTLTRNILQLSINCSTLIKCTTNLNLEKPTSGLCQHSSTHNFYSVELVQVFLYNLYKLLSIPSFFLSIIVRFSIFICFICFLYFTCLIS